MTVKGWVGTTQFIEFIKRLLHNMTSMVFLIVDGQTEDEAVAEDEAA